MEAKQIGHLPGGEIKRDPEIGKTAIQPERAAPAQTADLSISGSRLISSLCTVLTLPNGSCSEPIPKAKKAIFTSHLSKGTERGE